MLFRLGRCMPTIRKKRNLEQFKPFLRDEYQEGYDQSWIILIDLSPPFFNAVEGRRWEVSEYRRRL